MNYQIIARRFRPKLFKEVVGQPAVVATLLGAIHQQRIAQAYLFCGCRGTGKTTLARLFAKALNCAKRSKEGEPCNCCPSCKEISAGSSLDVLEIDGASHRGIEDIRQINEAVHFAPTRGKYKIYLIDEVHMLTKEAFNALLKTLEEPPEHVKFFFATTEPHKIPATILSRCQRLNLARIDQKQIAEKLDEIGTLLKLKVDSSALDLIARLSEGSLRDAQSLFDQVIATCESEVTIEEVREILGLPSMELFEKLDHAKGAYEVAFEIAQEVFSSAKHIGYFLEELIRHFRHLLLAKRGIGSHPNLEKYTESQLLDILELLGQGVLTIKTAPSEQVHLEMLLLQIIRSHERLCLESLVARLEQLERGKTTTEENITPPVKQQPKPKPKPLLEQSRIDTLTRFAAKELGGSLR